MPTLIFSDITTFRLCWNGFPSFASLILLTLEVDQPAPNDVVGGHTRCSILRNPRNKQVPLSVCWSASSMSLAIVMCGKMTYAIGMATVTSNRTSRLDIRLTAEQRSLIERAVSLKGSTITQWTAQHLLDAARREIEEASSLKLENESFDAFLRALDEPIPAETKELMRREPQWA